MLVELRIENFALIERLDIELGAGLNVITGETGAGKSIILSALSLILGERATDGLIREGCDSLAVEAVFFRVNSRLTDVFAHYNLPGVDEDSLVIKREVRRNGRNRCFVNNQTVTLGVLKDIGDHLVDLHGQHEHQSLLHPEKQREILDAYGNNDRLLERVRVAYGNYKTTIHDLKILRSESAQFTEQQNFYQRQLDELIVLDLKAGEEEKLIQESELLSHTEKIAELCESITLYFDDSEASLNLIPALGVISKNLSEISAVKPEFKALVEKIDQAREALEEVSLTTESFSAALTFDPSRLEQIESRLATIQRARKQYNRTIEDLIAYQEELSDKLADYGTFHQTEQKLLAQGKIEKEALEKTLSELSASRSQAKTKLERDLIRVAKQLAMNNASFEIVLKKFESNKGFTMSDGVTYRVSPKGLEEVEFLFSANPGVSLKPLAKVASGGEISRLMLALKTVIATEDLISTLIFDEIDVGIGGQVAHVVAEKLAGVSQKHQVVVITHLAQIAGRASQHYLVEKTLTSGPPQVRIRGLSEEERVNEIARMLGGKESSSSALQHAREMIAHD